MGKQIVIEVPEEICKIFIGNPERELKLLLEIKLWNEGLVSFEKASEIAGYDIETFITLLSPREYYKERSCRRYRNCGVVMNVTSGSI